MKTLFRTVMALVLIAGLSAAAFAAYPTVPVKILCHQSAGGSVDTTTRILAEYLTKNLNQPFVVENILGAGGRMAHTRVFTAEKDGYIIGTENLPTLQIGELAFQGQYKSLDFKHVFGFIDTGHVFAVTEDSPIKTMEDLVARMKAGRVTCATFGNGSSSHLQMITIADSLGVKDNIAYVHFEGTTPQLTAQLGNNTEFSITGYGAYAKTEGLRALAVAGSERDPFLPDVPTIAECGINADIVTQLWGFMAPPETPGEIVKTLNDTLSNAVKDPDVIAGFARIQLTPILLDTAAFTKIAEEQYALVEKYLPLMTK